MMNVSVGVQRTNRMSRIDVFKVIGTRKCITNSKANREAKTKEIGKYLLYLLIKYILADLMNFIISDFQSFIDELVNVVVPTKPFLVVYICVNEL